MSLRGLWKYRVSSFKTEKRRAVSPSNAWQGSQSPRGHNEGAAQTSNSRVLLILDSTSCYILCSETNHKLEYFTTFTNIRIYLFILYFSTFLIDIYILLNIEKRNVSEILSIRVSYKGVPYRNEENGLQIEKVLRSACLVMFFLPVERILLLTF